MFPLFPWILLFFYPFSSMFCLSSPSSFILRFLLFFSVTWVTLHHLFLYPLNFPSVPFCFHILLFFSSSSASCTDFFDKLLPFDTLTYISPRLPTFPTFLSFSLPFSSCSCSDFFNVTSSRVTWPFPPFHLSLSLSTDIPYSSPLPSQSCLFSATAFSFPRSFPT